jgi:hypothetical protein
MNHDAGAPPEKVWSSKTTLAAPPKKLFARNSSYSFKETLLVKKALAFDETPPTSKVSQLKQKALEKPESYSSFL